MNRRPRKAFKNWCTRAVSLLLYGTSVTFTSAQGRTDQASLRVRISVALPTVCVGDKAINVDVILINEGISPAHFDSRRVDVNMGYTALFNTTTLQPRQESMNIWGDQIPGASHRSQIIKLQPQQAYVRPVSLPLPTPFFSQPGFYLLMPSISIDSSYQADRNTKVIIEVRDCK